MTMGDLFTFILYFVFVGASLGGIADLYSKLQQAVGATENLLEIFDEEREEEEKNILKDLKVSQGEVTFKNINFSYPSRPDIEVLKDLSFEIKAGQQVALVGPSGAGKSTITSLILKFFEAQEGELLIDGKPIGEYSLKNLRDSMAIVPQDVVLFGGSIYDNILYGKPNAKKEEVIEAAQKANAFDFIQSFPDGFDTLVGERGIQLSGGQRQRVAIARAILKNPKILILDEATSSLDSQSEQSVQNALEELMKGRTSLVIAHRLSTIQKADRILVLQNGALIESGTHDELIQEEDGLYKSLKGLQMAT